MRCRRPLRVLVLAAATTAAFTAGLTIAGGQAFSQEAPALAQAPAIYDLPAQDLNAALLTFANRAGLQIFYDVSRVQGLRSAPLVGSFTVCPIQRDGFIGKDGAALRRDLGKSRLATEELNEGVNLLCPVASATAGLPGLHL